MPVIVNSQNTHPFLPSLGSLAAIDETLAKKQEVRPLEIAIINLMADKRTTERQLAEWLGRTPLQINLTFAATDSYIHDVKNGRETRHTPSEHINQFYSAWKDIKGNKYDGLVITGVNALKPRVEEEEIWPEVQEILRWSATNVLSSLFLCWGAKAALKHFHNIDSIKREEKLWGVFPHHIPTDATNILSGFADQFDLPVSRWKTPRRQDIENNPALEIVADSTAAGPNILVESAPTGSTVKIYPQRVYVLGHPEYETDTLQREYERDRQLLPNCRVPENYFPNNDPQRPPLNSWRPCAHIYTNWIHAVYDATPYDRALIPLPHGYARRA